MELLVIFGKPQFSGQTVKGGYVETSKNVLIGSVQETLENSLESIASVNTDLKVLAINAKIQAARVGALGAGFGVVADEMSRLAAHTENIISGLRTDVMNAINGLIGLESDTRGQRLAQIAAHNIDLVDRNLYERSCDVRWWATDSAIVDAASDSSKEKIACASRRMGVILEAYTVYFDLILCSMDGIILCNGRPQKYRCAGLNRGRAAWFNQALASASGSEYGFEGPLVSELADGKNTLIYSCGVREHGQADGRLLGVLGVIFNWDALGREVLLQAKSVLSEETENSVKCYICRTDGVIVSSSEDFAPGAKILTGELADALQVKFKVLKDGLAGVGLSRGFETYKTGWASVIVETLIV
jgi:hypothetical protein